MIYKAFKVLALPLLIGFIMVANAIVPPPVYTIKVPSMQLIACDRRTPIDSSIYSGDFFFYSGDITEIWSQAGYDPTIIGVWSVCVAFDFPGTIRTHNIYAWAKPLHVLDPHTTYPTAWTFRDTIECHNDSIIITEDPIGVVDGVEYDSTKKGNKWYSYEIIDTLYCYPNRGSLLLPYGPCDGIRLYLMITDTVAAPDTFTASAWIQIQ